MTDAASAAAMASLLAQLASALRRLIPVTGSVDCPAAHSPAQPPDAVLSTSAQPLNLLGPTHKLGPCAGALSALDATACAGGNAAALAHAFEHVTAVELDEGRAQDLLHNLRIMGLVRPPDCATTSAAGSAVVAAAAAATTVPGSTSASGQVAATSEPQLQPDGPCPVRVLHGDFTILRHFLPPHDVLLIDPPWGGPQYLAAAKQHQQQAAAGTAAAGLQVSEHHSQPAGAAATVQDERHEGMQGSGALSGRAPWWDLRLGDVPVSELAGQALGAGKAHIIGLKLPSVGSEHHQDLMARIMAIASSEAGSQPASRCLWGVQVQFGRSVLLVVVQLHKQLTCDGGGNKVAGKPKGHNVVDPAHDVMRRVMKEWGLEHRHRYTFM